MTFDIWGGPAPPVEGLDELRVFMVPHEIDVRQVYHPSTELADGEWSEGSWVVQLERKTPLDDGRIWFACLEMSNEAVSRAHRAAWPLVVELLGKQTPPQEVA